MAFKRQSELAAMKFYIRSSSGNEETRDSEEEAQQRFAEVIGIFRDNNITDNLALYNGLGETLDEYDPSRDDKHSAYVPPTKAKPTKPQATAQEPASEPGTKLRFDELLTMFRELDNNMNDLLLTSQTLSSLTTSLSKLGGKFKSDLNKAGVSVDAIDWTGWE